MIDTQYDIALFHSASATDEDWAALHAVRAQMFAEWWPDDPIRTADGTRAAWSALPPMVRSRRLWLVRLPGRGEPVAMASVAVHDGAANAHLAFVNIYVLPAHRRQGLGTKLLTLVTEFAALEGCTHLIIEVYATTPSAAAFLRRVGAEEGLAGYCRQLAPSAVDPALLADWLGAARDCSVGIWIGPVPDEDLEEVASVFDIVNDQPWGSVAWQEDHMTPERVRAAEAASAATGQEFWTVYARLPGSRVLAGFTMLLFEKGTPWLAWQGFTGVRQEYRQRGIARRIKAQMIAELQRRRPEVQCIRTMNATTNGPMGAINERLGFRPVMEGALWQITVEAAHAYLRRGATTDR